MNKKIECKKIIEFIRNKNELIGTSGAVLGISGGIDSSVCAVLLVKALGPEHVLGIIMPAKDSNPKDEKDAQHLAKYLGIKTIYHPVEKLLRTFEFKDIDFDEEVKPLIVAAKKLLPRPLDLQNTMRLRGRMYIVGYYAFANNLFQCQTLEKTEWVLGLMDKFGDAAGDVAPIFHLFKSEVYELANYLELPDFVLNRKPASGNYSLTDEEELQMKYPEETDLILRCLLNSMTIKETSKQTGLSEIKVTKLNDMLSFSQVKRDIPLEIE